MKLTAALGLLAIFCAPVFAQDSQETDVIVLTNGDVLTGVVKTLADGEVTFETLLIGTVTIPVVAIADMRTAQPVELLTAEGETLRRRITGIQDGQLLLAAEPGVTPSIPSLPLGQVDQINPPEAPGPTWTGAFSFGGIVSTGNTQLRGANLAFDAERRSEIDRISFQGFWDYQEDKDTGTWNLTQRRVGGAMQYDYFLSQESYVLATAGAQGDTFQDIELRFTGGAGYGYQWVESDDISFNTEAGLNYYSQEFRSATPSEQYMALRLASNLDWSVIEDLKLLYTVGYLPSLEDIEDYYVRSDTRLRLTMTENMFAQFQWVLEYDSTPSPGLDSADNRYLLSIGWSF